MSKLRILDLFSGIGGFSLGLERAGGFETVAFCEIDPFARRVLAKHWPEVPCYDDVRALTADRLSADGISVDVICGGFPCQNLSLAGDGTGLAGEKSSLWFEYLRLVGELRPRWVIIENVPALRSRGLDTVLGGLNALGYDAEWHCVPSAAAGGDSLRDRLWFVAHPAGLGCGAGWAGGLADRVARLPDQARRDREQRVSAIEARIGEPALLGASHGVPDWLDRVFALGNTLDPRIPEAIGRAILRAAA